MLYALIAAFAVSFLFVARAAGKQKKPFAAGFWPAVGGLTALAAVNALASFTGVAITINAVTAACAVVLGAPGVVLLLALRALAG